MRLRPADHVSSTQFWVTMEGLRKVSNSIIKPLEDKRLYRGLILANDLKVLLVSDSNTEKSAAALDVNVGSMNDPLELPGLAHFCEHMLFLGTEKYPAENEYTKYLSEHGGSSNASTAAHHTSFYFNVLPHFLSGALDMFVQFFISPLFTESAVNREVHAINSEHEKNISIDFWRLRQLDKSTSKPGHDFSKFGTGNKETLDTIPRGKGINVREELLTFHDKWYSSNIMSLCVLGKESLDELEKMTVVMFSKVKNKNVKASYWHEHPFGPDEVKMKSFVVPVKDLRVMNINFPLPDLRDYYKSGPDRYIGHLLAHQCPGSLLSAFRSKSWCNSLAGGTTTNTMGFDFFEISVDLTEEGMEHVDDIVELLFQYLNLLKEEGPKEWIFNECKDIAAMHFRFKDKEHPQRYVTVNALNLHMFPLDEVLCGTYIISEWRPDLIEMVLSYLTPDNVRVSVVAKKFEPLATEVEKWYGTKYKLQRIPDRTVEMWKNAGRCALLHLPPVNEFIPTDFSLVTREENPAKYPVIVQDTPLTRVWFKQDDEFLLPKACLKFYFVCPLAYLDPLCANMASMFGILFEDALKEYAFSAALAGLSWSFSITKYGIVLHISGYHSKQQVLLEKIAEKLTTFQVDPKRFKILKEKFVRSLKNFEAEQPFSHSVYYMFVLLTEQAWVQEELLHATSELKLDRLQTFIPQILSNMHIECLIHGNISQQGALQLVNILLNKLSEARPLRPLFPQQLLRKRALQLVDGRSYVYEVKNSLHRSSCVEIYYQCGLQNTESNILLELLVHIISEPCFDHLRTKEQLGYIVSSGIHSVSGVQGLRIIVQSDKHPKFVDERVEAFIEFAKTYLEELSEEEFEQHKESLAAQRLIKPLSLTALSARFWSEISTQQYNFDRANIEVAYLRTLKKQDILQFYDELIHPNSEKRGKLAVHVLSMAEGGAGTLNDEEKPATGLVSNDEEKPGVGLISSDEEKCAASLVFNDEEKRAAGFASNDEEKPAAGIVSSVEEKPAAGLVSKDEEKPAVGLVSSDEEKRAASLVFNDEEKRAAGFVSNDEEKPAAGILSSDEEKPATGLVSQLVPPCSQPPYMIEDIAEFKSSLALYPLVQPYIKLPKPANPKANL